jgi:hypothetical protein
MAFPSAPSAIVFFSCESTSSMLRVIYVYILGFVFSSFLVGSTGVKWQNGNISDILVLSLGVLYVHNLYICVFRTTK